MKPGLLSLFGLLVVLAGVAADTILLTRPEIRNGWWAYAVLGPGFLLVLLALIKKRSWMTIPLFVLALGAVGVYTGSRFIPVPTDPPKVGVGHPFPEFSLKNEEGKEVTLASLRKQGPVVLVLSRGRW